MSAVIASSKLNGQSETGFAFGIRPPMANGVEHSGPHILAEHAVPAAWSAICYDRREDVRILPVVMTERELSQIQRQIGLADVVIGAHHATLEQAPEAIEVGRVDVPAHILTLRVVHALVRKFALQSGIARMIIGRDQGHASIHRFTHEVAQRHAIRVLNDFADHVTFAGNRADHANLAASHAREVGFLAAMAVLILTTDIRFINLDFAHELRKTAVLHGGSDPVAHIPSRFVGTAADLALDLQGADALLALGHEVNDLEPHAQVVVGVLKHGFRDHRESIPVPSAAFFGLAGPMKRASFQLIHLLIAATRAFHAIRPTAFLQELLAGFFGREPLHQLRECLSRLGRHAGLRDVVASVC